VKVKETFKGFEAAERLGTTLGKTVLASTNQLETISKPALAVRSETQIIQLQDVSPEQLADAKSKVDKLGDPKTDFMAKVVAVKTLDIARKGMFWPMEVQAFRIDHDTAIVCLPCEIFVELGLAIKAASPFKKTIVISICNDRPSYVPTVKAFAEGSYEVTNSRVKPGSGERLVASAVKLLKELNE
jgi:neutral ceramidase